MSFLREEREKEEPPKLCQNFKCDFTCCVCAEMTPDVLACGHTICHVCAEEWRRVGKNTCPLCRKKIDATIEDEDQCPFFYDFQHEEDFEPIFSEFNIHALTLRIARILPDFSMFAVAHIHPFDQTTLVETDVGLQVLSTDRNDEFSLYPNDMILAIDGICVCTMHEYEEIMQRDDRQMTCHVLRSPYSDLTA